MSYVKRSVPDIERIAERVALTDVGCLQWTGTRERHGYGRITVRRVRSLAHRFVYSVLVGPIPAGLTLDHLCRNTLCVHPDHLEAVTHAENVRRGMSPVGVAQRTGYCKRGHRRTPDSVYGSGNCKACKRGLPPDADRIAIEIEDLR